MWMELVRIIVGLGITNDISGYRVSDYFIVTFSLWSRWYEVGIKAKMIFQRTCCSISLLYFSIILSKVNQNGYILELISYKVCAYLESVFRKRTYFDSNLRRSFREVWSYCLWKIIFNYRNMVQNTLLP